MMMCDTLPPGIVMMLYNEIDEIGAHNTMLLLELMSNAIVGKEIYQVPQQIANELQNQVLNQFSQNENSGNIGNLQDIEEFENLPKPDHISDIQQLLALADENLQSESIDLTPNFGIDSY